MKCGLDISELILPQTRFIKTNHVIKIKPIRWMSMLISEIHYSNYLSFFLKICLQMMIAKLEK